MAHGGSGGADAAGEGAGELAYGHGDPYRELWEVRHVELWYHMSDAWQSTGGDCSIAQLFVSF